MTALINMRRTDVGVATFSDTRKSKVKIEKEQMSTPDPVNALRRPERNVFEINVVIKGKNAKIFQLKQIQFT